MSAAVFWAGLAALVWLVLFQLLLALGLPLGRMAWGGGARVLSRPRRIASLVSAFVILFFALVLGQAGGVLVALPSVLFPAAPWVGLMLFTLSLAGNLASKSRVERLHGVPLALVVVIAFLSVTLG